MEAGHGRGARIVSAPMRRAALVAMCLAGLFVGCKPKAGATCKVETKEICTGDKAALVCHDGKWEEMSCRGATGCVKNGAEGVCDQSVAAENDVCNVAGDFVCGADKKEMLECKKNHWGLAQRCLGERGCTLEQKKVACDNSVAAVGDVCLEEDDYACSVDKKSALVCRSGRFSLASNCKGKNGCKVTTEKNALKVECDDSIANAGDTCDKEGHFACAPDEKTILKCEGKKFVAEDKCTPKQKCGIRGDLVGCY